MARRAITDPLQTHKFWIFDISYLDSVQLPVFSPLLGFSKIGMPEVSLETHEVREANWLFKKTVIKGGSISNITLETASTYVNSDFWKWTIAALTGDTTAGRWLSGISKLQEVIGGPSPRKNLVLVQFFARNPNIIASAALAVTEQRTRNITSRRRTGNTPEFDLQNSRFGPGELVPPIPAKAWILYGCLPVRCRPGSDFDASSAEISLQEIEISIEGIEEVSLADPF